MPSFHLDDTITISGTTYQRYDFEQSVLEDHKRAGAPYLPQRLVLLNFPGVTGNSVDLLTVEYEDIPQVRLAPIPGMEEGKDGVILVNRVDAEAYSNPTLLPAEIISLKRISETRGAVLGELCLTPLQYNGATRSLRKYRRIVARVNFGDQRARAGDAMTRGLGLNDRTSEYGAKSQQQQLSKLPIWNSLLATGIWYQVQIIADGIYKVSGQTLLDAGIPSSVDPGTVRVFSNGGRETPLDPNAPFPDDLVETAVAVSDGGTIGQIDPGDYLLFYGKSPRGWNYTPQPKVFSHYINRFADATPYFLAYGIGASKRMSQVASLTDPNPYRPGTVGGKIFREDERLNLISSGLDWVGQSFTSGDQQVFVHALPGLDPTRQIRYRFHLGARSASSSSFTLFEHDAELAPSVFLSSTQIGSYYDRQMKDAYIDRLFLPTFSDEQARIRLAYSSGSTTGNGYLDWFEVYYGRSLKADADAFSFHATDTTAIAEYALSGFSGGNVMVFDVSRYDSVVNITNPILMSDSCTFQVQLSSGAARELMVVGPTGFKSIDALSRVPNQNLHGETTEAEYIIVTHPSFLGAAQRLESHRERAGNEHLNTLVVTTSDIYNEFGGGVTSPQAIRNYLRYVNTHWTNSPRYVLLFGDGTYDYKGILVPGSNFVPAWETAESYDPIASYATDDDFTTFVGGGRVMMGVGRLAARSVQEANTMVDKIVEYESAAANDPWRIRVTFVADDGLAGINSAGGQENDGDLHVRHAESVAGKVPALFEQRKIYLFDYPTTYSSSGRRKPEVNEAIRNQINEGTVIINYSGHGNPRLWAHEAVFVRESDFPLLRNKGRYFFLIAATCNYSQFDALSDVSGGELLVAQQNAGAIATLSATRVVYAFQNLQLNDTFVSQIFQPDSLGRVRPPRLGDVIYRTKQIWSRDNDKKYFLLGDPALMLAFPKTFASVDSINQVSSSQVGQLRALGRASISGRVRTDGGDFDSTFSGTAQLVVYDANRRVQINDPTGVRFAYTVSGNVLFRGEHSISAGKINANFIVPRDISYDNDFGRMTLYFSNSAVDGVGYTTNFRVGGTDSSAATDLTGPELKLAIDDRQRFRPGDIVSESPRLIADLFDSSGINTSGAGIGHRLEAWIDGGAQSIDLSNYYKSKTDTYQEGTVEYALGKLPEGTHRLRMRAWDTHNNASVDETVFNIGSGEGLHLSNVYNYPNPFSGVTVFTFEHNQVGSVDVEIKVYTVAGRLIQSILQPVVTSRFVQVPWDGRDREGDLIANGTYLYKVIVRAQNGRFTSEAIGKLNVLH